MTAKLEVKIDAWADGQAIPDKYAFCVPDPKTGVTLGQNISPGISWSGAPEGTASFVILCEDPHVPADMSQINAEGVTIPADAERISIYHWVLVDIPAHLDAIETGLESEAVVPGGKPVGNKAYGVRGSNSYTQWFAQDKQMKGVYGGYDGPCPPMNDKLVHEYHFTVYALSTATLNLSGNFGASEVLAAIENKVLAKGEYVGTYTLNPEMRAL